MADRQKLQQMLAANPGDLFLKYAVAMACASDGAEQEAADRLRDITSEHPDYVAAWFQRGQILYRMGETDDARLTLQLGIQAARRIQDDHAAGEMQELLDIL